MKIVGKLLKFLIELGILLAAGYLLLGVAYYFGWSMLPEGVAFGNDIPSAMNNVFYLEEWYPPVPKWIHLWTGGIPFLRVYPNLPFLLTFFAHRWLSLPILATAKLILFLTIPLTALGTVALGRVLTKNWWVGLLAGCMVILSPDSWLWATYGGFYAVATSAPFFAWSLVFFCLAMENKRPGLFFLAAAFYGLTWLFHPMAGLLAAVTAGFLGLGYGVKDFGWRGLFKGSLKTIGWFLLGVGLFGWWIVPFFTREDIGGVSLSAEQMYRATIGELVGLEWPTYNFSGTYNVTTLFPAFEWALFGIGAVVVFFRKSILRWALLACGAALFIMTAPYYAQPVVKAFQLFWAATNVRAGLILRVLMPVIGSYGAMSLLRPIFWLEEKVFSGLKKKVVWKWVTDTIAAGFGLVIFWILFQRVVTIPSPEGTKDPTLLYPGFGPLRHWLGVKKEGGEEVITLDRTSVDGLPLKKTPQEIVQELPHLVSLTGSGESLLDDKTKKIVAASGMTAQDRIDVVPIEGDMTGSLGNYSQVSQIPTYMGVSLIQSMIGWQINCVNYDVLCQPEDIIDLYRWYGVSQVWLGGNWEYGSGLGGEIRQRLDRVSELTPRQLEIGELDQVEASWSIYDVVQPTGLASVANKPAILVIGDNPPNNDVYDIVFKVMPRVGWGYDKAWTVDGKRFVDDYTLNGLSQFEVVILHGYQLRDEERGWHLLEEYVSQGGNVFINTGWKYYAQDWGKEVKDQIVEAVMPEPLPVSQTYWQSFGKQWPELLSPLSDELDGWGELVWEGYEWAMAGAKKEWLRPGATPLLTVGDWVVVAEQTIGNGKVVWTGFDLFGHLLTRRSVAEEAYFGTVFNRILSAEGEERRLDFTRERPELITVAYTPLSGRNKLMFKEVASDNWEASLAESSINEKLPIYRAGPGWKMVFVPADSGKVVFSWRRNRVEWLGLIITVFSVLVGLGWVIVKVFFPHWQLKKTSQLKEKLTRRVDKLKRTWEDDEQ